MTAAPLHPKKLIEVALPLAEINDASAYDKMPGIGAHPKGIHHWWARLPLPAARAVLFASVVDDPSSHPERFATEDAQAQERERLFGLIRRMMQPRLHEHPEVYAEARAEMLRHCGGALPPMLDPFAGGGSIPLEAARLGLPAHAGDLNPVAVLLNKVYLEIVPRWADWPPVNPEARGRIGGESDWRGAAGLADDVRYYGRRILARARERIGGLYPPATVTEAMAAEHLHLKALAGKSFPVIAWLWARTVASPDPAARGAHVPLMSTFWLSSKKGSEAWLEPVVDRAAGTWRFLVRVGPPGDREAVQRGTKTGRAQFRCLLTDAPIADAHIKREGQAGRLGARLVAIVADAGRGRLYLPAIEEHARIAAAAEPTWRPEVEIAYDPIAVKTPLWGLKTLAAHFTPRQLTALVTLSDLIRAARTEVQADARAAGLPAAEADAYAAAVVTGLALALDRCADFNNALTTWKPSGQQQMHLFGRQAIPMVWDFAEADLLGQKAICWANAVDLTAEAFETVATRCLGRAYQADAAQPWDGLANLLISTDPPYYDNIGYAALSDFFYVWLRRTVGDLYPDLFATILVPKAAELVAAPERFGGDRARARAHFEQGFARVFAALRARMDPRFPLTVYYAFKQDDAGDGEAAPDDGERLDRTTGWETLLAALIGAGFQITATWPLRASQRWRMNAMETNALASYIVIACRPRPDDAPAADRRAFVAELKRALPAALRQLQQGNIAPVDFAQAAIGPGMAVFSKYSRVLEADGRAMGVRAALGLINQMLSEALAEQEDEFDNETRWAVAWFAQYGFEAGDYGQAELLSKAKVTSVRALVEAGMVAARGGQARLLRPEELAADWQPEAERRMTVWAATHHLLRLYWHAKAGEVATAALLRRLGAQGEAARELAYRLFDLCERRQRSAEAQAYNALVLGWPELARLAREAPPEARQGLFGDTP